MFTITISLRTETFLVAISLAILSVSFRSSGRFDRLVTALVALFLSVLAVMARVM